MTDATSSDTASDAGTRAFQPLLNDAVIVLRAPTQVWSAHDGQVGAEFVHGVYHGDVRYISDLRVTYGTDAPEWISLSSPDASRATFGGLMRALDDGTPDPKVRLLRERTVEAGRVQEVLSVVSNVSHAITTTLRIRLAPEFAPLQEVKAGTASARPWTVATQDGTAVVTASDQDRSFTLAASGASVSEREGALTAEWTVSVPAGGRADVRWSAIFDDESLVVCGAGIRPSRTGDERSPSGDFRLRRWLDTARGDLDALRLALPGQPSDAFYAAGAPWFLTLFGRDSIWAARLSLPVDREIAASTLRVLARLQGTRTDAESAEQPGKILHELRSSVLEMPGEGISLPPVYYGTVDATPLWICLLADSWRAGMPESEVRELLPALRAALDWLLHHGDSDGDGFLDYIDQTGHGLANQGWKDSGDSIQWRSGELAQGPIALCEVQGYAYEAALGGADLLDHFEVEGGDEMREWAAVLKARFAESFWVTTPEGRYPGIALDAHKRPVDTLTSNIGHLLGTGILDPAEEESVARLLIGPTMLSGFGVRTMSTSAGGYWPLSYHGGSVWTHDSAIIARGMALAGLDGPARVVVDDLLAAAEGFDFRMPELHSGDSIAETSRPVPYPAACRPQAWSAAAAITAAHIAGVLPA